MTMEWRPETGFEKVLYRWVDCVSRQAWMVTALVCIVTGASLFYAKRHLRVDTDTAEMLAKDLPFRVAYSQYKNAFPSEIDTILILIEAPTPELADEATRMLAKHLQRETVFKTVYIPGGGQFFEENGLLYLSVSELEELVDNLASAQPLLSKLSQDYSLHGLFSVIGEALASSVGSIELALDPLINRVNKAIQANLNSESYQLSWQHLIDGNTADQDSVRRFIIAQPDLDFSEVLPGQQAIDLIRRLSKNLFGDATNPVRVRLTGDVALAHEEMKSVSRGTKTATLVSIIGVFITLFAAFRSLRLVFATVLTLIIGLILTLGFATIAVGHLNLISVAFAVLYIGLGVDYAIHFNLRYKELLESRLTQPEALRLCAADMGPSLTLCAISTAIGFFAFVPTQYTGVSELGLISGTGMALSLIVTLIVLPAILNLFPSTKSQGYTGTKKRGGPSLIRLPVRFDRFVCWVTVPLALGSLPIISKATFDIDPMNLRDPKSESVETYWELVTNESTSPLTITTLAKDRETALTEAVQLETLDTVDRVVTVFEYIPDKQEEKLALIDELDLVLGPLEIGSTQTTRQISATDQMTTLKVFLKTLNEHIANGDDAYGNNSFFNNIVRLRDSLNDLLNTFESVGNEEATNNTISTLERSLLDALPNAIDRLRKAVNAHPVDLEDLPSDLVERWISKDGIYRVEVFPKEKLSNQTSLQRFVSTVQGMRPDATGAPVITLEASKVVVRAFKQAFLSALVIIAIILTLRFRNITDPIFVILPLVFAGVFTVLGMSFLSIPFNFANIIALPLLFGLGVDNGIHMVHCVHQYGHDKEALLSTSTARGIFFSGLTTIFSFGTLAFISHAGVASMGKILVIGVFLSIICTLFVLPAFLSPFKRNGVQNSS